jgi:hypothetical protein
LTAITGVLTPALSIPFAAGAVLLFGCVKVTDTYKSVNWQAVATVGGMMSVGLALEKTGAAGALAHAIVIHLQWAGTNLILGALLALTVALTQLIENAAVAIILAPIAYQIAREGHADPKPFMVALAICFQRRFARPRPRDHHAGDGARPIPFQALPFHRQWNGRHRLAAHHVRDPVSLEVLIRRKCGTCHARAGLLPGWRARRVLSPSEGNGVSAALG